MTVRNLSLVNGILLPDTSINLLHVSSGVRIIAFTVTTESLTPVSFSVFIGAAADSPAKIIPATFIRNEARIVTACINHYLPPGINLYVRAGLANTIKVRVSGIEVE